MVHRIQRGATGRRVVVAFCMLLVFSTMILPWAAARLAAYSGGGPSIALNFGFTPADAFAALEALGPDGRTFYLLFLVTGDVIWPIVYALFLGTLLAWLFARGFPSASPAQRAILLPFLALAADYAENVGIIAMILAYPARLDGIAQITSMFQMIKWSLIGASGLLVALGAIAAVVRRGARA
ncbi:MAG: hypothetical protein RMM58_12505 [Chloroflexota bacterium]|nr:hypothetical protein [Dehalococcoidia bacterium]MDW8254689.1 hypothetical protein [Chloroflexota bacterium]